MDMNSRYFVVAVVVLAAMIITSMDVYAQEMGPGRWWQRPGVAKELNLTDRDKQALDDMFIKNRDKFIDMKSDLDKERLKLDDILNKDPVNEASAASQYKRVEEKRQKISAERFRYILGVRKILGPDRFQRLTGMAEEMRKKRFSHEGQGNWGREYQPDQPLPERNSINPPNPRGSVSPGEKPGGMKMGY
jgi:Spy/CpxP family protein refolding chaperone